MAAEKSLDHSERKITLFNVDRFRRPSQSLASCHKIGVCRDDGVARGAGPIPNRFIRSSFQACIADVEHTREQ